MIRQATSADLDAVEAGYTALLTHEKEHGTNSNWILGVYPTRAVAEASLAAGTLYVLEEGGRICASMICNHAQAEECGSGDWAYPATDEQVLVLHTLCVPPAEAGRGCGTRMVRRAIDLARQLGCTVLRLDTWAGNKPAAALHRGLGFSAMSARTTRCCTARFRSRSSLSCRFPPCRT